MYNDLVKEYYDLNPRQFSLLLNCRLDQQVGDSIQRTPEVTMVLELRMEPVGNAKLRLVFYGVRNLQIRQPHLSLFQITQLDIDDIRNNQWEDIGYKVIDREDDSLEFLCRIFTATILPINDTDSVTS